MTDSLKEESLQFPHSGAASWNGFLSVFHVKQMGGSETCGDSWNGLKEKTYWTQRSNTQIKCGCIQLLR
jgi:hypothetical protein